MKRNLALTASLALALAAIAPSVEAQQVTALDALFGNSQPAGTVVDNVNPDGTVRACWPGGTDIADTNCDDLTSTTNSIYTFNATDVPFDPGFDNPFGLGVFVHYNNPIDAPLLTSVDLFLTYTIQGVNFSDTWTFSHNETPNSSPSSNCEFLSPTYPCADEVTFALTNGSPQSVFKVGNTNYKVDILGFGPDANNIISSFITQEFEVNRTILWASISSTDDPQNVVPEPATMTLLATGLVGMAAARRRRKNNA